MCSLSPQIKICGDPKGAFSATLRVKAFKRNKPKKQNRFKSKNWDGLISDYIIALNIIKNLIYRNSSTLKCIILTEKERKICAFEK